MSIWLDSFPKSSNPLRFLLFVSRPHWRLAALSTLAVFIASIPYVGLPYLFKLVVDTAISATEGGSPTPFYWTIAGYVLLLLLAHLCWRVSGYTGATWATGARATARYVLSSYVTLHSKSYFSDHFAGAISSKIKQAADSTREFISLYLWQFSYFFILTIGSFGIAFYTNPTIAWTILVWAIVVTLINVAFARKRSGYSIRAQEAETLLNGATVDLLSNIAAMQEYARRGYEVTRLKNLIHNRRIVGLRNWFFGETILVINGLVQAVFGGFMAFIVIRLVTEQAISPGDVILILTIIFSMEERLLFIGQHLNDLSEQWGTVRESLDEILVPHEIVDKEGATHLRIASGAIDFKNVSFYYGGNRVLDDFTFSIGPGERVGLVGRSGAGKTTIIKLLLRHHDIDSGAIVIDGQNIAEVTQDSLHEAIAMVPQESVLFHRSLGENIAYGKLNASQAHIGRAAALAHANEFIERLPDKYNTLVGERGVKLSGGERQRIAIARAIIKDAPILVLDEATSSLDSESEKAIQQALHALMEGKTVIAVAHRLSTLREMDRIVVLDGGKIVEDGSHDELIKKKGLYSELWSHQSGGYIQDE
jgi:ATP-binding cassette subfamily B protein